ncbi:MAG: hypothetical protein L3J91_01050 [Thermoplasmata archaeon]|nr:hypothetical protein [Thermoplasmata archaeon]
MAIAAVLLTPGLPTPGAPSAGLGITVAGPVRSATISMGPQVGVHFSNPFFGIVWQLVGLSTPELVAQGRFFNSTPITWFRLGGEGEGYNPTTTTDYLPPITGIGLYRVVHGSVLNYTWFESWCKSKSPTCSWLDYLPAEQNSSSAALHYATWFHSTLGFAPTAWEFGNEPNLWDHYGLNQTLWSTLDRATPSGVAYATMVHSYISAIGPKYPSDQFLGIEASGPGAQLGYVPDTAKLNGLHLSAMAYHFYPALGGAGTTLSQFYGGLDWQFDLGWSAGAFRSAITQNCPACANLPIELGEFQSGPATAISPLALTYAGAPFMAASVITALESNVTTFSPFNSLWFLNSTSGKLLPQGLLYQRILDNMTMGTDYATNLSATGVGGLFSILIKNGTHESLLIVNTNSTQAIRLPISTSVFPVGGSGSFYLWGPSVAAPIPHTSVTLPTSYIVPQQGILLINNY